MSTRPFLGILLVVLSPVLLQSQTFTVLKSGSGVDGHGFNSRLILGSDGKVYGSAFDGGANGVGTLFGLSASGTGFATIHDFATATGSRPAAAPIEGSDGLLYGITSSGGTPANTSGVLYSITKAGTGYTVLREFSSTGFEGADGQSSLLEGSDGKLYGIVSQGGPAGGGTIFRVDKNGGGFVTLKLFANEGTDGSDSIGHLIQGTDGRLYGVNRLGGNSSGGTIFRLDTDGNNFQVIRHMTPATDGGELIAGLLQGSDGKLYGAANTGGAESGGTLFSLNLDGTGFLVLKAFSNASPNDGLNPQSGLVEGVDGRLYGACLNGGTTGSGTLFSIAKNGTGFQLLHTFDGTTSANPFNDLVEVSPGNFFGSTVGGAGLDKDVIFRLAVPLAPPVLTITGKKAFTTSKASATLKGTAVAVAGIAKIEVKSGSGKFKTIQAGSKWTTRVRLETGLNRVFVKLTDTLGRSSMRSIKIKRE